MRLIVCIALSLATAALPAAAQDLPNWFAVQGGAWQVPQETLAEVASHVQDAADKVHSPNLRKAIVDDYRVQYQGVEKDGKQLVRLMGACHNDPGQGDPTVKWHIVFDGGKCYYDAAYDPALHTFVSFSFHGMG